jgi:CTP:molybdopterin cytidylyltransferase MocA
MPESPVPAGVARSLDEQLHRVRTELAADHPELSPEQVRALVEAAARQFSEAKITEFVPILVRRHIDAALRHTAA